MRATHVLIYGSSFWENDYSSGENVAVGFLGDIIATEGDLLAFDGAATQAEYCGVFSRLLSLELTLGYYE